MLNDSPPPIINSYDEIHDVVQAGCRTIMDAASQCSRPPNDLSVVPNWDVTHPRWARILNSKDPKLIWKSVNWKGTFDNTYESQPSDSSFKQHFEQLLTQGGTEISEDTIDLETAPYIPVLDDPFLPNELENAITSLNRNKSYSGICPGILKVLPISWFLYLLTLFNIIFNQSYYPLSWCYNKLVVLFKGGNRLSCDNYRGISIMDTLAKIYDTMILNRLLKWYNIDKCQAGAQKGRSCLEQIITLRMLCDYALYKKCKLYVLFIDYSKAYDRVSRQKLIQVLKSRGCGKVMIKAIQSVYRCTKNVLKTAIIDATIGVRQGAPSSCLLFIIYIDEMVKMIKRAIGNDGFLGMLHALLLMDDTVVLATSRDMCEAKFKIILQYGNEFGMGVNVKKTKFFVINGSVNDKIPIQVESVIVNYSPTYLYLGAWFTDSGKIKDAITLHERANQATVNKFAIFCAANTNMPFEYKKKVLDAL